MQAEILHSLSTLPAFLAYFGLAVAMTIAFVVVYLWITPHVSGDTPEGWQRGIDLFCANLRLFLDGHPQRMGNIVDLSAHL